MLDYSSKDVTLDEIVFEDRNRSYGAYDLRKRYPDHIKRGGIIALFLAASAGLGPSVLAGLGWEKVEPRPAKEHVITVVLQPKQKKQEALPGEKAAPRSQVRPEKPVPSHNPARTITAEPDDPEPTDSLPVPDEPTPIVDAGSGIGTGLESGGGGSSTQPAGGGGGIGESPEPENKLFAIVEEMPKPGYDYSAHIARRASFTAEAIRNEISGVVYVQFVVEPDGSITNAHVVKGIGYGCDESALNAIRSMPPWLPGKQGNQKVRVQMTLPVNFQLR